VSSASVPVRHRMAPTRWDGGAVFRPGTRTRQLVLVLPHWRLDPVPLFARLHPAHAQTLPGHPLRRTTLRKQCGGAAQRPLPYLGTIECQEGFRRTVSPLAPAPWGALERCHGRRVSVSVREPHGWTASGGALRPREVARRVIPCCGQGPCVSLPALTLCLTRARPVCTTEELCCSPRYASAAAGPVCRDVRIGGRTHALCLRSPTPDGFRAARVRLRG
jgi:hypothetical protein